MFIKAKHLCIPGFLDVPGLSLWMSLSPVKSPLLYMQHCIYSCTMHGDINLSHPGNFSYQNSLSVVHNFSNQILWLSHKETPLEAL